MQPEYFVEKHFRLIVILLCLLYFCIELAYLTQTEFNPDEAQGAYAVHRLKTEIPYRDFKPYKTILGYYLQLPIIYLSDDPWTGVVLVRGEMVLITTAVLMLTAFLLARHFRKEAICLGLLMLVPMSNFLERSFELRVDMLTSLCGLVALLLLLDRRYVWSGILCALSFFFSQKGVYYVFASGVALASWVLVSRDRLSLRKLLVFHVAMLGVLVAYIGFWSSLSSLSVVLKAIFFSHADIAFKSLYSIHAMYWGQTLWRNPFFYSLGLIQILYLLHRCRQQRKSYVEHILLIYAGTLLALGMWHKQPWPYFFLILIPTIFVLHVSFFHHLLPWLRQCTPRAQQLMLILFVVMSLIPLGRLQLTLRRDSGHQMHMIELLESFLDSNDGYIDGNDLMYQQTQAVPALRWLDTPQLRKLHALPQEDVNRLIQEVDEQPIKVIIHNWRVARLPPPLYHYLRSNFSHLWGNLYIYAPALAAGETERRIKFSGTYLIMARIESEVFIDGRMYHANELIQLQAGFHHMRSQDGFRLKFLPKDWEHKVDNRYFEENPDFMKFRYYE